MISSKGSVTGIRMITNNSRAVEVYGSTSWIKAALKAVYAFEPGVRPKSGRNGFAQVGATRSFWPKISLTIKWLGSPRPKPTALVERRLLGVVEQKAGRL